MWKLIKGYIERKNTLLYVKASKLEMEIKLMEQELNKKEEKI